jgi:translation initiation factor 3 subunit K
MASSTPTTSAANAKAVEALRTKCHTLLLADRYNPSVVLQPLEDAVNSQCSENWYDAELNSALLKLYQMHPSEQEKIVKVDVLVRILLKALMQLPDSDFSLAMMMVPEPLQNLEIIRTICLLAEKLQTASFPEFWDLARANPDLIHKVAGFQTACRRHVLRVVGMTFREISSASLAKYLGLGSARDLGGALAPEGLAFLNEEEGTSTLPPNADNHPKSSRVTTGAQEVRLEQVAELIASLESGKQQQQKRQGQQGVSATGKHAVERMHQALATQQQQTTF